MAQDNVFQGEMDPEIAALLGTGTSGNSKPEGAAAPAQDDVPDYSNIFNANTDIGAGIGDAGPANEADTGREGFPPIQKRFEETGHAVFDDPAYYKTNLSAADTENAQREHNILQKFMNTKDPKDRGVFRQQLIMIHWEFLRNVAKRASGALPDPMKYLLRFGVMHPAFLDREAKPLFSKIVVENTLDQPIYYLDEWFKGVGTGTIRPSTTDEVKVTKSGSDNSRITQLLEKAKGKLSGAKALLKGKDDERRNIERSLSSLVARLTEHSPVSGLPDISSCYSDAQKRSFVEIQESLKTLIKIDHDVEILLRDYSQAEEEARGLKVKAEEAGAAVVDLGAINAEFDTIRQMAKMTIGRQGNHFPILTSEYYHGMPNDLGCRENVISTLAWIESIDPEAFCRSYKNHLNRIVPYVILIPSYGDTGVCWEPFDKFNRATSRGRIAVPMYPRSLQYAVLTAVADIRWQVAKEKASFYWMEEGITGNYYQWFQKMKLKGDLKEAFIGDYITWVTKESEGTQKLDKELRGVFWRHMPFSQPVKEKLKTRNFTYQELYQRDVNRTMSDGY